MKLGEINLNNINPENNDNLSFLNSNQKNSLFKKKSSSKNQSEKNSLYNIDEKNLSEYKK